MVLLHKAVEVERGPKLHKNPAVSRPQNLGRCEEVGQTLRTLLAAIQLLLVGGPLDDGLVADRHGDKGNLLQLALAEGLHQHIQHAILRRVELARARPRPLDEELQREALREHLHEIGLEDPLVEDVARERTTQEEGACTAEEPADRPEIQVDAGRDVGRHQPVTVEQVRHDEVVDVALVAWHQHNLPRLGRLTQLRKPLVVDLEALVDLRPDHRQNRRKCLDPEQVEVRRQLRQDAPRLSPHIVAVATQPKRQPFERLAVLAVRENLFLELFRALHGRPRHHPLLVFHVLRDGLMQQHRQLRVAQPGVRLGKAPKVDRLGHLNRRLAELEERLVDAPKHPCSLPNQAGRPPRAEHLGGDAAHRLLGPPLPDQQLRRNRDGRLAPALRTERSLHQPDNFSVGNLGLASRRVEEDDRRRAGFERLTKADAVLRESPPPQQIGAQPGDERAQPSNIQPRREPR